jgi:hypothetical protein
VDHESSQENLVVITGDIVNLNLDWMFVDTRILHFSDAVILEFFLRESLSLLKIHTEYT